jgi:hypothetical protein
MTATTVIVPATTVSALIRGDERGRRPRRAERPLFLLVCIRDPDLVGGGEPARLRPLRMRCE